MSQINENQEAEGCLGWLIIFAVVFILGLSFAISPIFGTVVVVIGITAIIAYIANVQPQASGAQTPETLQAACSIKGCSLPKDYYNDLSAQVLEISHFAEKLGNDIKFLEYTDNLSNVQISVNGLKLGNLDPDSFAGKVKMLILIDAARSLINSGHKLNLNTREGAGLLLMLCNFMGKDALYEQFDNCCSRLTCPAENMLRQLLKIPEPKECFLLGKLMGNYNLDNKFQYHILLYRYTSLIAKSDGVVSDKESKWLDKIMGLGQTKKREETPEICEENNPKKVCSMQDFETLLKDGIVRAVKDAQKECNLKEAKNNLSPKFPNGCNKASPMEELNALVGLSNVKSEIAKLANLIKIQQYRKKNGLRVSVPSYHFVFTGNPGTGKTTVARIVAEIYRELGILEKGHLIETDRSGLVAEYVGQTAVKTNEIIDEALDGVLFIDEAYTLFNNSREDFGHEAIATLLKRMEDEKDRLVVILAGYSKEMQEVINSNPGLRSRFNRYIDFPDYSAQELLDVFKLSAKKFDYMLEPAAEEALLNLFSNAVAHKTQGFGNGRFARNIFDKTIELQSTRLSQQGMLTVSKLAMILPEDIPAYSA